MNEAGVLIAFLILVSILLWFIYVGVRSLKGGEN